jgi:methionine salvage enolase-phosphatase E1
MTTIERLTKAGRKLGLKGQAGQNGYLYYWAHGSRSTDLGATNYADALESLEREAALLEECEKAEEQHLDDLVKEHARG